MQYDIKSTKTGKVKTLCTISINEKSAVKIISKISMQLSHFKALLEQIKHLPERAGEKRIDFSDTLYALRKEQNSSAPQNDALAKVCAHWKKAYKEVRKDDYASFTSKELGLLRDAIKKKFSATHIDFFMQSDAWFAENKTVATFCKYLQEIKDLLKAKAAEQKVDIPDTPSNAFLDKCKPETKLAALAKWREHWDVEKKYVPTTGKFVYEFTTKSDYGRTLVAKAANSLGTGYKVPKVDF